MATFVDRNEKPASLPSGTVTSKGTTGGSTAATQTTSGGGSTVAGKSTQNMTPDALSALEQLVLQLSDHPAVNESSAVAALSGQGLVMPTFSRTMSQPNMGGPFGTSIGTPSPVLKMTNEYGRPVHTEADYRAALARYNAAKEAVIAAGGTVAGGTKETKAAKEAHDKLIATLATEHESNVKTVAGTNAFNRANIEAQMKVYADLVAQAAVDHKRNIQQNLEDRAIVQQNLQRAQVMQSAELQGNKEISSQFSKEAAFKDASTLTANYARKLAEQIMPTILRAGEASGTSGSAVQGLLAQDAVARTAEAAAANAATMADNYGKIQVGLAGVNANLLANDPKLQEIAPVSDQQIIKAPDQLAVQLTNDNLAQVLSTLTDKSSQTLDALLKALEISRGAVENTTSSQNTSSNQTVKTVTDTAATENKAVVQKGTGGPNAAAPTAQAAAQQTTLLSPSLKVSKASPTVDDNATMWDNYSFGG